MPDLSRFAALAAKAGASPVPPVPPAVHGGGTAGFGGKIKRYQRIADPVPPVPPVPPREINAPHHADLMDAYEERAAILEFDAHLSRAEAERIAWNEVFGNHSQYP
ncbi:hypothetical protein HL658_16885 [Azospirillum sp. RWY-5-1]|uniref:Uncharacterized protein n=1 Tax=Azospirillum oleiclasticum TaxID=2735135 RepID=A0ABX2TBM0_9PROT|nr:hypothetical protein [Azospirillum oleiclasticum]NYZ14234.1 hypothetical protein [Azospirillum oleiclasticum]NYZ21719.1 hypothetical protein [Azospirillum oleiclasticum]